MDASCDYTLSFPSALDADLATVFLYFTVPTPIAGVESVYRLSASHPGLGVRVPALV